MYEYQWQKLKCHCPLILLLYLPLFCLIKVIEFEERGWVERKVIDDRGGEENKVYGWLSALRKHNVRFSIRGKRFWNEGALFRRTMCLIVRAQQSAHALADNSGLFTVGEWIAINASGRGCPLRRLRAARMSRFREMRALDDFSAFTGNWCLHQPCKQPQFDPPPPFQFVVKFILICALWSELDLSYARLNCNTPMYRNGYLLSLSLFKCMLQHSFLLVFSVISNII